MRREILGLAILVCVYDLLCIAILGLIAVKTNAWWVMLVAPFMISANKFIMPNEDNNQGNGGDDGGSV